MRFNIVAILFLVYFNAGLVNANPFLGVRCVQSQLNEAGYQAGPVDGLVGRKTRSAIKQYESREGAISSKRFQPLLGDTYCRIIGLRNPVLQEFWPSKTGLYEVVFSKSISPKLRARITQYLKLSEIRSIGLTGLQFAGKGTVVVAANASEFANLIPFHSYLSRKKIEREMKERCSKGTGFGAIAFPGLVLICKVAGNNSDEKGKEREQDETLWWNDALRLREVIDHEFVHLLQLQLTGGINNSMSAQEQIDAFGPIWLVEGIAQVIGIRSIYGPQEWSIRNVLYQLLENQIPDLSDLETLDAVKTDEKLVYFGGGIAVADLIELQGYPAIFQVYEQLGHGIAWSEAFHKSFGMSVDDFYDYYRTVERFYEDGAPKLRLVEGAPSQ